MSLEIGKQKEKKLLQEDNGRPHEVNKFIAEEKANHKQDIKDSLAGAYHKEPVRTVEDVC